MEDLKKLLEEKRYNEVLRLTKDSSDGEARLCHLAALVLLGEDELALKDIALNEDVLLKVNAYKVITLHIEILLTHKMFKEAKEAVKHYQLLPYISQRVEELLASLPERIENEEHPTNKVLSLEQISDILATSEDDGLLSEALFSLKQFNFQGYVDSLLLMIKKEKVHPNLRTLGLISLKENEYDKEVEFLSNNKGLIKVTPSKIEPPFTSTSYQNAANYLVSHSQKNVTVDRVAMQLLNCLVLDLYPDDISFGDDVLLAKALISLAKDHINDKNSKDSKEVILLKNKINDILKKTPELVI